MKQYYRVSLGEGGKNSAQAKSEGWVGVGWMSTVDLTGEFPDEWRKFNKKYIDIVMEHDHITTRIGAGLACGMTWTVCRGLQTGDFVVSTTADSAFMQIGTVTGPYYFAEGQPQPHRRSVHWEERLVAKSELSDEMKAEFSGGTVQNFTRFAGELEAFLRPAAEFAAAVQEADVENPYSFAMEKYLEDFLLSNWQHTALGKDYDIFEIDGVKVGQQYLTDTGPLDILAISKDKKTILVVELKRGKVSDVVVGQIQRYMGYVQEELCEPGQTVKGVIIGLDDDKRIQRALVVTKNIEFYLYEVNFKLHKGN
jgi:restriction system protein